MPIKNILIPDDDFLQSDLFIGIADSDRMAMLNQGERIRSEPGEILFSLSLYKERHA
jgi:hypothetical protein